jgi:hypothetical protein
MENIDLNIKRMLSLLESKMGDVKPLINEQFVPTSLPKQDWISTKNTEDWLKWIVSIGCLRNKGIKDDQIENKTVTSERIEGISSGEKYIKVNNFPDKTITGQPTFVDLYIFGKKSDNDKGGYFKMFVKHKKVDTYTEARLNCSNVYNPETTSVASEVQRINVEDPINKALFSICYTRQPDPNYAPQSESGMTIKEFCGKNPGVCGTNSLLKQYADGQQGDIKIFEMSPTQKEKSGCRTNEDIVNTRQSLWNLKRQNKKTLKSVRDKQSCRVMLETMKACNTRDSDLCNQLINNNQDLRGLDYPAAKMKMVKYITFCRDENMYNQNQLERVNDLQLEQTIGKNIRESLKELNLINKIG